MTYILDAGTGVTVAVLDYGAIVQSIRVPDRDGRIADVVLGYDTVAEYERDRFYLGTVVGRYAGRIGGAAFTLDGMRHALSANDPPNHLHGGFRGFGKVTWRARELEDGGRAGVVLEHTSPAGSEGYPGNLDVRVTCTLSPDHVFAVEYRAVADRPTPVNLTQHSYFNLAGEGSGDVLDHELTIHAKSFTPLDARLLPTGEIAPVAGTPLDFRAPRRVGERIGADDEQLRIAGGYDHNFVIDGEPGALRPAARLADAASGRVLEVFTTEPGMQLYTGNFLDGTAGKHGHRYGPRAGLCLETQHFPDSPNQPGFPSTILRPGAEYRSRTEFRFSVEG
ncbi:MAG: aldose epimerase family protein [Longimicrobiaceae bacterium]